VLALLIPGLPHIIKEFAYFGFGITLISASIAHISSGDSGLLEIGHSFFFISLLVSYLYYHRINHIKYDLRFKTSFSAAN
jgi:putative oxidoreductase